MAIIGERLKALRLEKKSTQREIAEAVHITEVSYQRYEYGTVRPSLDTLIALADYFDVSVDYLTGRSNSPFSTVACAVPVRFHAALFDALEKAGIHKEQIVQESPYASVVGEGFIVEGLSPAKAKEVAELLTSFMNNQANE